MDEEKFAAAANTLHAVLEKNGWPAGGTGELECPACGSTLRWHVGFSRRRAYAGCGSPGCMLERLEMQTPHTHRR